jgi:hypothetical protein
MPLGEALWLSSWLGEPCSSSSERLSAHGLEPKASDAFSFAPHQPTNTTHAGRDWIPHFDWRDPRISAMLARRPHGLECSSYSASACLGPLNGHTMISPEMMFISICMGFFGMLGTACAVTDATN